MRETTGYKSTLTRHVLPRLGSLPRQKVQPLHLQRVYRELLAAGLSPRMCRLTHTVIHNFKQARRQEARRPQPRRGRRPAQRGTFRAQVWRGEEVLHFLAAAQTDRLYVLRYLAVTNLAVTNLAVTNLAMTTGMRRGELLGTCAGRTATGPSAASPPCGPSP